MPDPVVPPVDPAAPPADPAVPPVTPPADPPPAPEGEWKPPTREEVEAKDRAIAEANRRAKKLETAASVAEQERQQKAGEFEQLYGGEKERAEKLEGGIKTGAVKSAVIATAQRLGFKNPLLASRVIDISGIDAELADDYTATVDPTGQAELEKRLLAALAADPYLGSGDQPRTLPGAGDPPAGSGGGNAGFNDQIRGAIRR